MCKMGARTQWVKWERICLNADAGGLGIRSLSQLQITLHGKLMWLVMKDNSLWAKFAGTKYFVGGICTTPNTSSPIWRSISAH